MSFGIFYLKTQFYPLLWTNLIHYGLVSVLSVTTLFYLNLKEITLKRTRVSKRCDRATVWLRKHFQRLRKIWIFERKMHNFTLFHLFKVIFQKHLLVFGPFCLRKTFQRSRKIWVFERKNAQFTTVLPFLGNFSKNLFVFGPFCLRKTFKQKYCLRKKISF